jgi:2-haloacid dehalogenase
MIKALTFDVFGTVFDWRGTIIREGEKITDKVNWEIIAIQWAREYALATKRPWRPLDEILRRIGEALIADYDLEDIVPLGFTTIWERLEPFPDSVSGLQTIRDEGYEVVALSNANQRLMESLSAHAGLEWSRIISTDRVKAFKPSPLVYQHALSELKLNADEVLMTAAHLFDLRAAKAEGMNTAFIYRSGEEPGNPKQAAYVDKTVRNLYQLGTILCL